MANRPVFEKTNEKPYYFERGVDFTWNSGFSPSQKKKNVTAIHEAYKELNGNSEKKVLEISSKSEEDLGISLSAFNLKRQTGGRDITVECVYQGSKVFENGGPYTDLYNKTSREAKKDPRLQNSGALKAFQCGSTIYKPDNQHYSRYVFYDWLYITALLDNEDFLKKLRKYDGFTDVEYSPNNSGACQARSAAIAMSLDDKGLLDDRIRDFDYFLSLFV